MFFTKLKKRFMIEEKINDIQSEISILLTIKCTEYIF